MPDTLNPSRNAPDGFTAPSEETGTSAGTQKPTGPEEPIDSGNPSGPGTPDDSSDYRRLSHLATDRPETAYVPRIEEAFRKIGAYKRLVYNPENIRPVFDLLAAVWNRPASENDEAESDDTLTGQLLDALRPLTDSVKRGLEELKEKARTSPDTYREECADIVERVTGYREGLWIISEFLNRRTIVSLDMPIAVEYELFLSLWEQARLPAFCPLLFITRFPVAMDRDPTIVALPDAPERGDTDVKYLPVVLGISGEGDTRLLHVEAGEAPVDWEAVFTALRERGLKDVFCVFHDSVEGAPEGVTAVFPKAPVFRSLRNTVEESCASLPEKEKGKFRQAFVNAFRAAPDAATGLKMLGGIWKNRAPEAMEYWRRNLAAVDGLSSLPPDIRAIALTTDPLELAGWYADCDVRPCPTPALLLPYFHIRYDAGSRRPWPHWGRLRKALSGIPGFREIMNRHREKKG